MFLFLLHSKYHLENDAQNFKTHIKKLQADNEKLKNAHNTSEKANNSTTEAPPSSSSSAATSTISSSKVVLECELFAVKHKNTLLTKTNTKLEKDNKERTMRCQLLEEER